MELYSGNPVADAAIEMQRQDSVEYVYDHKCACCNEGFDKGHGVQIEDEKFCYPCFDQHLHVSFYRECGLNDRQIYELLNQYKPI
jgi:formylmethanofuran dehydrogenase subunit E